MPQTTVCVFQDKPSVRPPIEEWLEGIRKLECKAYVKCLAAILMLEREGFNLRRPTADLLRNGVYELRIRFRSVNYRILYFFCGKNAACLSHGLIKEDTVPDDEIELAIKRKEIVRSDTKKFTKAWKTPS